MGCGLSKAHIHPEILVSHGNARLTVHGRRLIVQRHQQGWRQAHIAAAMGVSRKCVKTWVERYAAEGEAGLADRSCRPHTMRRRRRQSRWSRRWSRHVGSRAGGRTGSAPSWGSRRGSCPESCAVTTCPTCVSATR